MAEKQNPLEDKLLRLLRSPLPKDGEVYRGLREAGVEAPDFGDGILFEQIIKAISKADTAAAKFCMDYSPAGGEGIPPEGEALEEFLKGLSYAQLLRLASGGDCTFPGQ